MKEVKASVIVFNHQGKILLVSMKDLELKECSEMRFFLQKRFKA